MHKVILTRPTWRVPNTTQAISYPTMVKIMPASPTLTLDGAQVQPPIMRLAQALPGKKHGMKNNISR